MIELSTSDLSSEMLRNDGRVRLVSHISRVGATALLAAIEWYWYPPGTERSRLFDIYGAEWADTHWIITVFPQGRLHAVRRLARQLGLRVADASPIAMGQGVIRAIAASYPSRLSGLLDRDRVQTFPGAILPNGGDNTAILTLEYDKQNPTLKNRPRDEEAMRQASAEINELFNRGQRLTPAQIVDYIYGSGFSSSTAPDSDGSPASGLG